MAGTPGKVGVVFVSHSAKIAEGLVELAAQMAGSTSLVAAGGTDEGGIGTSFDKVSAAVTEADSGHGVAVLCDLGSAILTAETALEVVGTPAYTGTAVCRATPGTTSNGTPAFWQASSSSARPENVAASPSSRRTTRWPARAARVITLARPAWVSG